MPHQPRLPRPAKSFGPSRKKSLAPAPPVTFNGATGSAGGAKPGAGRLNTTGRALELNVPLRDGGFYLGDVEARVSPSDEISLPKDRLAQMMTPF